MTNQQEDLLARELAKLGSLGGKIGGGGAKGQPQMLHPGSCDKVFNHMHGEGKYNHQPN